MKQPYNTIKAYQWARNHGEFNARECADHFGWSIDTAHQAIYGPCKFGSYTKRYGLVKNRYGYPVFYTATNIEPPRIGKPSPEEVAPITPLVMFDVPGVEIKRVYYENLPVIRLAA